MVTKARLIRPAGPRPLTRYLRLLGAFLVLITTVGWITNGCLIDRSRARALARLDELTAAGLGFAEKNLRRSEFSASDQRRFDALTAGLTADPALNALLRDFTRRLEDGEIWDWTGEESSAARADFDFGPWRSGKKAEEIRRLDEQLAALAPLLAQRRELPLALADGCPALTCECSLRDGMRHRKAFDPEPELTLQNVLQLRFELAAMIEDHDTAWRVLLLRLRLADTLAPVRLGFLEARRSARGRALAAAERLYRLAPPPDDVRAALLASLQSDLDGRRAAADLSRALRGELIVQLRLALQNDSPYADRVDFMERPLPDMTSRLQRTVRDHRGKVPSVIAWTDAEHLIELFGGILEANQAGDHALLSEWRRIEIARRPDTTAGDLARIRSFVSREVLRDVLADELKHRTRLRAFTQALELTEQMRRGARPIDKLSPRRADPFRPSKPLRWSPGNGVLKIWSRGEDERDDGGLTLEDLNRSPELLETHEGGTDITVTLPMPLCLRAIAGPTETPMTSEPGPPDDTDRPSTDLEEELIRRLRFLQQVQHADGTWQPELPGVREVMPDLDITTTALVLLAFIEQGQTHRFGRFKGPVKRALDAVQRWSRALEQPPDESRDERASGADRDVLALIMATLAIQRISEVSRDFLVKRTGLRLTRRLLACRHRDGGWGLRADGPADSFLTIWAIQALDVGLRNRMPIRAEMTAARARALEFLTTLQDETGRTGYRKAGDGDQLVSSGPAPAGAIPLFTSGRALLDARWPAAIAPTAEQPGEELNSALWTLKIRPPARTPGTEALEAFQAQVERAILTRREGRTIWTEICGPSGDLAMHALCLSAILERRRRVPDRER